VLIVLELARSFASHSRTHGNGLPRAITWSFTLQAKSMGFRAA
jgi:hypothetical protein